MLCMWNAKRCQCSLSACLDLVAAFIPIPAPQRVPKGRPFGAVVIARSSPKSPFPGLRLADPRYANPRMENANPVLTGRAPSPP